MNVIVTIDFNGIAKDVDSKIMNGVNDILKYLKSYAIAESPIDTGEYNKNHKITPAKIVGQIITGKLENNTKYAEILEYGVLGRTYNYHRRGKTYMTGVGARVYTRTQDNNLKQMESIMKKALSFN